MRLTATNVGKKIKGKTVLSNIDLDLKSGNIYGFVGPNGKDNVVSGAFGIDVGYIWCG